MLEEALKEAEQREFAIIEDKSTTVEVDKFGEVTIKFTPEIYIPRYMYKEYDASESTEEPEAVEEGDAPGRRLKHKNRHDNSVSKSENL